MSRVRLHDWLSSSGRARLRGGCLSDVVPPVAAVFCFLLVPVATQKHTISIFLIEVKSIEFALWDPASLRYCGSVIHGEYRYFWCSRVFWCLQSASNSVRTHQKAPILPWNRLRTPESTNRHRDTPKDPWRSSTSIKKCLYCEECECEQSCENLNMTDS